MGASSVATSFMSYAEEDERRRNLADRWWRLTHLYKIVDESGNVVDFRPNQAQVDLYSSLHTLNVVLKARQLGFSTFILIFMLDACLFTDNTRAGVIAHSLDDAEALFRGKVKFAYDHLEPWLKERVTATTDRAGEIVFSNGSSIRVSTSMRSGTLQYLHVSELGKIGRKWPEKDEEIKTGSLPTVHEGGTIFFESTAEGKSGLFFDTVDAALKRQRTGAPPHAMEFKLHFYPWHRDARYRTDPSGIDMMPDEVAYFRDLKKVGIQLDSAQQAWYVLKSRVLLDKMGQEYPSTVEEAFAVSLEGAYYANDMAQVRARNGITQVPLLDAPVNTFWDIGNSDGCAIWFHQDLRGEDRFVGYYEEHGQDLRHYATHIQSRGYLYGTHFLPHDAAHKRLSDFNRSVLEQMQALLPGHRFVIVPRVTELMTGIFTTRKHLKSAWFDAAGCEDGIARIDGYRKRFNRAQGQYVDADPDKANGCSEGADALRQWAQAKELNMILGESSSSYVEQEPGDWRL
jgi:hypothetical protein